MLEVVPGGFEERQLGAFVELAAYTDADAVEARLRGEFGTAEALAVAADWAERWRTFHRSIRVGPLWVGPPWEEPPGDAVSVLVDPGLAFGTGAHPTTRLCLDVIAELERGGLVDIGCGSGVLAVAAARLGYGPVLAVDSDPFAVEAARSNAARNDVRVDVRLLDALADRVPGGDVAVANIALPVVERLGVRLTHPVLVTSGYLIRDEPVLPRYRRVERRVAGGWAADVFRLSTPLGVERRGAGRR